MISGNGAAAPAETGRGVRGPSGPPETVSVRHRPAHAAFPDADGHPRRGPNPTVPLHAMLHRSPAPILLPTLLAASALLPAQRVATIESWSSADTLGLSTSRPGGKSIAMDRLGRLFALSQVTHVDGRTEVHLHRSSDGGRSFETETTLRVADALRGSLVIDPDGSTLHIAWGQHRPGAPYQVGYSRYDTRFRSWIGSDELLFPGATDGADWYWPELDVGRDGRVVVVCSGGRAYGWRASMRYRDGAGWTARRRINAESTGVYPSVAIDDAGHFHFSYRIHPNLSTSHIAYRRYDPQTGVLSQEVVLSDDSSNTSVLALDSSGAPHVLFAKRGALMLASANADPIEGFQLRQVARDAVYSSQNAGYDYFALAVVDGTPCCYYANAERGQQTLYRRQLVDGRLTEEVALRTAEDRVIESVGALRSGTSSVQELVTWTERGDQDAVRAHLARTVWNGTVTFGHGCPDSALRVATLTGTGTPAATDPADFTLELRGARPSSSVLLLLGSSDAMAAGSPLPLDLSYAGMPGCRLYQNGLDLRMAETDASGHCTFGMPIPAGLGGVRILAQAAVLDPEVNVAGLVTTGGLTVVAGD